VWNNVVRITEEDLGEYVSLKRVRIVLQNLFDYAILGMFKKLINEERNEE
jgi:hypothetical protein